MDKSKKIKTRIQQKHDIEANWLQSDRAELSQEQKFVPLKGELIIYDQDNSYSYERFKIGDGVTTVSNLPFASTSTRV